MWGRKIKTPTTAANIETKRTIPAETSLAIFASKRCSLTKRFITSSIDVFIISDEITKTIKIQTSKNSGLSNFRKNPAITTIIAMRRWILMF